MSDFEYYRTPYAWNDVQMNPGKNGKPRRIGAKNGMPELINIVAGLQKDIKRINQCLTLPGAQQYVSNKPFWQAHEADITGPNGKPDGVKEVFVTDPKGNIKVMNGWALTKGTYPQRKLYQTVYPTRDSRRAGVGNNGDKPMTFSRFKGDIYRINEDPDENGHAQYLNSFEGVDPSLTAFRGDLKPKDIYKALIFKSVWDDTKQRLLTDGMAPLDVARIATKALAYCYKFHIENVVIANLATGRGPDTNDSTNSDEALQILSGMTEKDKNRIKRSADFKTACIERVYEALAEQDAVKASIDEIITGMLAPPAQQQPQQQQE